MGESVGNFGPVPGGSTILMQTAHFIMYADSRGNIWRYMHEWHARWPVEFNPPIKIRSNIVSFAEKRPLTIEEIEALV